MPTLRRVKLERLVAVFREVRRVLRSDGNLLAGNYWKEGILVRVVQTTSVGRRRTSWMMPGLRVGWRCMR